MQELEKILEEIDNEIEKERAIFEGIEDTPGWRLYEKVMKRAKDIIRKHMNDGWIPVDKENLPDHEVLACDKYGEEIFFGYLVYDSDAEIVICDGDTCCLMSEVIAWMEKPEPYRPERSEE